MPRRWIRRLPVGLACLGVALSLAQPRDGWSKKEDFRTPEKNEKRMVRRGPDQPDEALKYIMLAMRDENGNIPADGLMIARQQLDAMRASQAQLRVQALAAGEPDPAAGITNASWAWIGPGNIGGRTRGLAIHPTSTNIMFAGSVAGGIWKTTDSGASWAPVDDFMANLAVTCIVFQPGNPSVMYASTGEGFGNGDSIRGAGIFKSTDGGTTWSQLAATAANNAFNFTTDLAFSPDGSILLASTTQGLYRSTDGGTTFPNVLSATLNLQDVKFLPGSNSEAVAGGRIKNAYWSDTGGATWSLAAGMTSQANSSKRVELAVSASSPNVVYASVAEGQTTGVPNAELWVSTDNGHSYTLRYGSTIGPNNGTPNLLGAQGWYDNTIWVDPTNENVLVIGGVDLFRSVDGGVSFSKISSWQFAPTSAHADHHFIVHDPGFNGTTNKRVYFANDGGLYKAEDVYAPTSGSGTTLTIPFNVLNNNYGVTQFFGGAATPASKIYGGTQDNGTLIYTGNPQAWFRIAGGDGGFATADQTDSRFLYGEFQNLSLHRSSNGGLVNSSFGIISCNTAAPLADACLTDPLGLFIAPILLDPNEPNRLLAGGASLWRTNDARTPFPSNPSSSNGPSWSAIKPPVSGGSVSVMAIQTGNSDRIWVGYSNSDIWITNDGTAGSPSWTKVDKTPGTGGPPDRGITQISIDPFDPNVAYVSVGGFSAGNVWKTTDSGTNWFNISGSGGSALPSAPVRSIVPHPSVAGWLYAGTDVGIFASTDGGATWKLPHDGPANVAVFQLFWTGNTLVAVTHGRGMYTASVPPPSTPATINAHPQSQTVGMGSPTTLSVAASGSAPFSYQWFQGASGTTTFPVAGATSATFGAPPVFVSTSLWVRVTNDFGTADSNTATITPQTGLASYDTLLKAPKCTVVGSACDTGPSLVLSRANLTGGAEPNQPNTINNSCTDGTVGTFHVNPSIDSVKIATLDASPLAVGKTVKIDVGVWIASTVNDRLDLFGAPNAASPSWTLIATLPAPVTTGAQTLTNSTYVLPAGGLQAIRASLRSTGAGGAANICGGGTTEDRDDLIFAVSPASGIEIVTNGDFSSGSTNWLQWEAPNIVSSIVGGVFQFFQNTPPVGSGQATVFQTTGQPVVAGGPLLASFKLGNSSTVRKRISVLVLEHDFSDLSVCTFWLPANQSALKTYTMRTHTTKGWTNAAIYFYAATSGSNGGNYLVDDVSLKYTPAQANDRTECVDANAPTPFSGGVGSANMLTNGDFASGTLLPGWSAVAPITTQITSGVLEFLRPNNVTPAGNIMQTTGVTGVANQLYTATFAMGNSSNVRKRVTVLLHDLNLSSNPDLTACTFWLPPGLPLSNYTMRGFGTQSWTNATISFYPATVGMEQWMLLDNVTFARTAPAATLGTECIEPATITFPIANSGGGGTGNNVKPAAATSSSTQRSTVAGGAPASRKADDGPRLADDKPFSESGSGGWNVQAAATRREVLRWADPVDLTHATQATLNFMSLLSVRNSSAEVQVSRDGVTWETLEFVPPTIYWSAIAFDLSAYLGQPIYMQFVFDAVAPDSGVPPDAWRFYDAIVIVRTEKGGG